jgi:hypothetical protein
MSQSLSQTLANPQEISAKIFAAKNLPTGYAPVAALTLERVEQAMGAFMARLHELIPRRPSQSFYLYLIEEMRKAASHRIQMSLSALAHDMKVGRPSIIRWVKYLEAVGRLTVIRTKEEWNWNDVNVYILNDFAELFEQGGGGIKKVQEKLLSLKTNTPKPSCEAKSKSETQLGWEARQAFDAKAHQVMTKAYELKGQWLEKIKSWSRGPTCSASFGVYVPPTPESLTTMAEVEEMEEYFREKERQRDEAKRLEEQRAAAELARLEAHREGCEECKGKGFVMQVIGGRIMQLGCRHGLYTENAPPEGGPTPPGVPAPR